MLLDGCAMRILGMPTEESARAPVAQQLGNVNN